MLTTRCAVSPGSGAAHVPVRNALTVTFPIPPTLPVSATAGSTYPTTRPTMPVFCDAGLEGGPDVEGRGSGPPLPLLSAVVGDVPSLHATAMAANAIKGGRERSIIIWIRE